jgi:cell wall-associated NlpC family hydrolase
VNNWANNPQTAGYGFIHVPLAIFWSAPNEEPVYKEISNDAAANPDLWSQNLSIEERLWLVGKVDTMSIFGERLVILDQQGPWLKVAAVSQLTRQNMTGYPGWVLADQVCTSPIYLIEQTSSSELVISAPKTAIYSDPALTKNIGTLTYQTRLPLLAESEGFQEVRLPDGKVGYLSRSNTKKTSGLVFSPGNIVNEARQFLGLKYLWGGTSSYGFDCSGFMFRIYQSQGIYIPRDASEQAQGGIPVTKENLSLGDLLFFAHPDRPDTIHHVGMYIGEGLMIHSPNSKSVIRIELFEAGVYGEEYWGARRYSVNGSPEN